MDTLDLTNPAVRDIIAQEIALNEVAVIQQRVRYRVAVGLADKTMQAQVEANVLRLLDAIAILQGMLRGSDD